MIRSYQWRSLTLLDHRIPVLNDKNIQIIKESWGHCCERRPQRGMIMHTESASYLSRLEHQRRDTLFMQTNY